MGRPRVGGSWIFAGAVALLVALSVVVVFAVGGRRHAYVLQMEMASTGSGAGQLFFERGQGINAVDVRTRNVHAGAAFETYQFDLIEARYLRFRFDPLAGAGTFRIRNVRVIDDAGETVLAIAPDHVKPLHDVAEMAVAGDEVKVTTPEGVIDPYVEFHLDKPLDLRRHGMSQGLLTGIGVGIFVGAFWLAMRVGRMGSVVNVVGRGVGLVDRVAAKASEANWMMFDRPAILILAGLTVMAAGFAALGLHGSGVARMDNYVVERAPTLGPLVGEAQESRIDEWNIMMPAILYQVRRAEPLAVGDSMIGPDGASLLGNLPVRHFSTLFRPQFWGFFVLPEGLAFSVYWQFKIWVLLVGLFLLFKLFTGSTWIAIFGALWVYFSSYTQWWFSTPAAMPEMVGLLGFTVVGACYLLVGRSRWGLMAAAVLTAGSALDFAMCAYVPFLVPLAWIGVLLLGAFVVARRRVIAERLRSGARVAAIGVCVVLIGATLAGFYGGARSAVEGISQTTYPGHRSLGGGMGATVRESLQNSLELLASHAFSAWATQASEERGGAENYNAFGFYWLGPVAILLAVWQWGRRGQAEARDLGNGGGTRGLSLVHWSFAGMAVLFGMMLVWMTLPVPAAVGHLFYMHTAAAIKCLLALGLVNVMVTLLFMVMVGEGNNRRRSRGLTEQRARRMGWDAVAVGGIVAMGYLVLEPLNGRLGHLVSGRAVILAVLLMAAMVYCLARGHRVWLAVLILGPLMWANGMVNPIDRGFHVFDRSALRQVVRESGKKLQAGKWLVFSDSLEAASFFTGNGLEVFNSCKFVPDMKGLAILDPAGKFAGIYNQAGYLLAAAAPVETEGARAAGASFRARAFFVNEMTVSVGDPALEKLGIRYVAFDVEPGPNVAGEGMLRPLYDHAVDGFWLYELAPAKTRTPGGAGG